MNSPDTRPFYKGKTATDLGADRLVSQREFAALHGIDASMVSHSVRHGRENNTARSRISPASLRGKRLRLYAASRDLESTRSDRSHASDTANAAMRAAKDEQSDAAAAASPPPASFALSPPAAEDEAARPAAKESVDIAETSSKISLQYQAARTAIAREELIERRRKNKERRGELIQRDAVAMAVSKLAGGIGAIFDSFVGEITNEIAAEFKIPRRRVHNSTLRVVDNLRSNFGARVETLEMDFDSEFPANG